MNTRLDARAFRLPAKNPPLKPLLFTILGILIVGVVWLFLMSLPWPVTILAFVVLLALIVAGAYAYVMMKGGKPFPTAPDSDLRSVLKALYLQQKFVQFVSQNQGVSDADLYANFATFIGQHKPRDLDDPTQEPGVIRS